MNILLMIPLLILSLFILLLGLAIGSFLNYVIYRLSLPDYVFRSSILGPQSRSQCPHCNHILSWKDLIPIFSYIFLRGKCRYCQKPISLQYPIIETLTAVVFLFLLNGELQRYHTISGFTFLNLFFLLYVTSVLIILAVYDLKHYLIPDKLLFPAIAIAFFYQFIFNPQFLFFNAFLSALIAFLFFAFIYIISKGTWMGFGDAKLAILLGLILGFPKILLALFLAFAFGAIIGSGAVVLKKKELKGELPFAPFLVAGTLITILWGQAMLDWYLHFILF